MIIDNINVDAILFGKQEAIEELPYVEQTDEPMTDEQVDQEIEMDLLTAPTAIIVEAQSIEDESLTVEYDESLQDDCDDFREEE